MISIISVALLCNLPICCHDRVGGYVEMSQRYQGRKKGIVIILDIGNGALISATMEGSEWEYRESARRHTMNWTEQNQGPCGLAPEKESS